MSDESIPLAALNGATLYWTDSNDERREFHFNNQ